MNGAKIKFPDYEFRYFIILNRRPSEKDETPPPRAKFLFKPPLKRFE
jgi:hypothetical protein